MKKNTVFNIISNGKDTVPLSVAGTGTILTAGAPTTPDTGTHIVGTGTLFLSEVQAGDWIYSPTLDEVQQVRNVIDNLNLVLYFKFSTDITVGLALKVSKSLYSFLSIELTAAGKIDNVAIAAGRQFEWYNSGRSYRPLDPITVDATGTVATFSASAE